MPKFTRKLPHGGSKHTTITKTNFTMARSTPSFWKSAGTFSLTLLKAVYLFLPGLFFLMAYYFIIIQMPIGQDMLMQSGENPRPFIWTVVGILTWMLFSWYSSRLLSDVYEKKCRPPYKKMFRHFPRLIAYNVAVCLQLAILNLPTVAALHKSLIILFIAHNLFYILLDRAMNRQQKKLIIICIIIAAAYIIYLVITYFKAVDRMQGYTNTHLKSYFGMLLIFFVFQVVFVTLVVWRRKLVEKKGTLDPHGYWFAGYNALAALAVILYIIILESGWFADRFGALGVTLLAFSLWVGLICLVKSFSIKLNVRLGLPVLILAILYGLFLKNPYKVRLQDTPLSNLYTNRLGLDPFLSQWLKVRDSAIQKADTAHPFNVYMIIADGGASKSGYWVASVLSKLEDLSPAGDKFSKHILSLAGASGGSVGNTAFYTLLLEDRKTHAVNFSKESRSFFQGDFLTSSFARFLGPDLFRHIFPFLWMDDRAALLEQSMQEVPGSIISNYFKGSVDTILDQTGGLPALFINTTNLESGSPGVVSNIRLDTSFTSRMDILKMLDTTAKLTYHNKIKLSTAVILGARFPYISPAGEINGKYFVDGGYFDNSGGGITLEMLQYIETQMNDSVPNVLNRLKDKLNFKVIYISNGNNQKEEAHDLSPLVNDLAAPMLTVVGTYGRQTSLSNQKLEIFIRNKFKTTSYPFVTLNLPMDTTGKDTIPYPMNWVISDFNLDRMKRNLDSVHPAKVLR